MTRLPDHVRWLERRLLVAVCLLVPLLGCTRLSTGARKDFARQYSCPDDRVQVRSRDDLNAKDLLAPNRAPAPPPPLEVKNDPARYALWKANQAAARAREAAPYGAYEVFTVTGCGHTELLACRHPQTPDRRGTYPTLVSCLPPATTAAVRP